MERPFDWQVGFVGPPGYFDASPSDLLRLAPEGMGVQARAVTSALTPNSHEEAIAEAAEALAGLGADLIAVVGSNWSTAGLASLHELQAVRARLEATCDRPVIPAPLAIIEALSRIGAERISLNATYSTPDWRQRLADFFISAGFSVAYAGSFVDQGFLPDNRTLAARNGCFPKSLAHRSLDCVWQAAVDVDAIVVSGIPCFADVQGGATQRMVHLTAALERRVPVPIVSTDTAIYQGICRKLGLPDVLPGVRMATRT